MSSDKGSKRHIGIQSQIIFASPSKLKIGKIEHYYKVSTSTAIFLLFGRVKKITDFPEFLLEQATGKFEFEKLMGTL